MRRKVDQFYKEILGSNLRAFSFVEQIPTYILNRFSRALAFLVHSNKHGIK